MFPTTFRLIWLVDFRKEENTEKLRDDGRQVMGKAHISIRSGELEANPFCI
jgi:hypothetical protein